MEYKRWKVGQPAMIQTDAIGVLEVNDENHFDYLPNHPENYIIEQFTGAVDKNGKEIFEGDILRVKRCHTGSVPRGPNWFVTELIVSGEEVGEVMWPYASFEWAISFEHIRYDDFDKLSMAEHRCEVIGNIHETPQLLKK
jgi:uncharacterized phage protein (TIGR01671 family)